MGVSVLLLFGNKAKAKSGAPIAARQVSAPGGMKTEGETVGETNFPSSFLLSRYSISFLSFHCFLFLLLQKPKLFREKKRWNGGKLWESN